MNSIQQNPASTILKNNPGISISCAVLIISFFLPWVEIPILTFKVIDYSGWDLPKMASSISRLLEAATDNTIHVNALSNIGDGILLVYLLPISTLTLIYLLYKELNSLVIYAEMTIAYICIGIFTIILQDFPLKSMGVGLLGTFLAGGFIFYDSIKRINR